MQNDSSLVAPSGSKDRDCHLGRSALWSCSSAGIQPPPARRTGDDGRLGAVVELHDWLLRPGLAAMGMVAGVRGHGSRVGSSHRARAFKEPELAYVSGPAPDSSVCQGSLIIPESQEK